MNRFTAIGMPVTVAMGKVCPGKRGTAVGS